MSTPFQITHCKIQKLKHKNVLLTKERFVFAALLLLFMFSQSLVSNQLDDLDAFIEKMRVQYKTPGVAVAVVKDDKIIFVKGYGLRRIGSSEKVDADTVFQLASVSKTFTSAALGVLVDRGAIEWDQPVIKYFPEGIFKDLYTTRYFTARDLLSHRTGLPAFTGDLLGNLGFTREEILYRIRFLDPAVSFREKALYSNVGFFIAGQLLAKVSGASFEKSVEELLLRPLKMTRTGFTTNLEQENVAYPHAMVNGKMEVIPRNTSQMFAAAGGLSSTARDMGNWVALHLNQGVFEGKSILSPKTIKTIESPSVVAEVSFSDLPPINENSSLSFTLGWNNYDYQGHVVVEKGGALDGVRSVITLVPEKKLGIVVLANLNLTVLPERIRAHFLEIYLGKSEQGQDNEVLFKKHEEQIAELIKEPIRLKNALGMGHSLKSYIGDFKNDLYGKFQVLQEGEGLIIKGGSTGYQGRLIPWSNDTFLLKWSVVNAAYEPVTFTFGPEGRAIELQTETLGNFLSVDPSTL
jgi:CubicO group peptidase (beta-lactamase class C family)